MKKESYRHNLPHFQQPGQAYFITWILKDAVPQKAFSNYTSQLQNLKNQLELFKQEKKDEKQISELRDQYQLVRKKYFNSYDDLLARNRTDSIDLTKADNLKVIIEALKFLENVKLKTYAYSIMPNHVHWVLRLFEKDQNNNLVYLQDIMHSVKRYSANKINKLEGRKGTLWQKESFDTTIRDNKHLFHAIEYTLNNPVNAGFVVNRNDWPGSFLCTDF